jgi:hypothetical protein
MMAARWVSLVPNTRAVCPYLVPVLHGGGTRHGYPLRPAAEGGHMVQEGGRRAQGQRAIGHLGDGRGERGEGGGMAGESRTQGWETRRRPLERQSPDTQTNTKQ